MHVILEVLCSILIFLLILSCSESKEEVAYQHSDDNVSFEGNGSFDAKILFVSRIERRKVMMDYEKPSFLSEFQAGIDGEDG